MVVRAGKTAPHDEEEERIGLDHFEMPRTVINRRIKATLPDSTQVRKDAGLALSGCTAVFISYLGQAAQEHATDRKRKTVAADDVLAVIGEMGLPPDAKDVLLQHLAAYREAQQAKRKSLAGKSGRKTDGDAPAAEVPKV